jgi:hypothetical protein
LAPHVGEMFRLAGIDRQVVGPSVFSHAGFSCLK